MPSILSCGLKKLLERVLRDRKGDDPLNMLRVLALGVVPHFDFVHKLPLVGAPLLVSALTASKDYFHHIQKYLLVY
jgi:hypothetical protein